MKYAYKHLITAGLLAAFGLAANAQTPPAAPGAGPTTMARDEHGRFDPAKMQQRMERRNAELKQKLQLTPAQDGAWAAYTGAMKPPANMQRPQRGEFEKLTTPERIDRMRTIRAARSVEMDKRADATKTFYAALSPEQKRVFDANAMRGHGGGHGGEHGRHHSG